ncbi:MAG: hypothetical protein JJE52_00185 [Acidimicrobiia bacterium]|nr:hypothetical protein [Acidimicrobiia bacterium]
MPITAGLRFCPFDEVADEPNIVVDATPTTNTTLTLSHWPGSPPVAADIQADLSAQMAFRYLDHHTSMHGAATAVSTNHFDQDGLVGIYALLSPADAMARRPQLEDLAAAGDFGTYRFRDSARASMVVSAFTDPDRSPLGTLPTGYGERTRHLYEEVLPRLPDLVDRVEQYRHVWAEEDAALTASEAAIDGGAVGIDERPDVDLAVVTVPSPSSWWGHRFAGERYSAIHPMAIHNRTERGALLLVANGSYRFTYRYESWVEYRSRAIRPRVDLSALAEELTAADDVTWTSDSATVLTPELAPTAGASSSLEPSDVIARVVRHLHTAPTAFDPHATPS